MMDLWHHPWLSGLFGDTELASILSPEADIGRMLQVEAAWTRTIGCGPEAERIAAAILAVRLRTEDLKDGTARDGLPVPELVRCLKAQIPEEDHKWLHKGLTSQDVIDTSLMIALQDALPVLSQRLFRLSGALSILSERDGARSLMAATRMQAALPIKTSDRIAGWVRPLSRLLEHMPEVVEQMRILQWGGPVGLRDATLPDDTGTRFAEALNLRDPGAPWHSDRSVLAELAGILSQLTGGGCGRKVGLSWR